MSAAGFGRGYYGDEQLDRPPRKRNWLAIAGVVGVGAAAIWFLLPQKDPKHAPMSSSEELDQLARSRGFSSVRTYEDSVIANARELRASGAHVELAPQLQHLTPRVEAP